LGIDEFGLQVIGVVGAFEELPAVKRGHSESSP